MGGVTIEAFESREAAYDAAAAALAEGLRAGLAARPRASFAGAGGSTPGPVYERLARAELDWTRVDATLVDERCVPEDSPESNTRLLRQTLLTGPASAARFVRLEDSAVAPLLPFDAVLLGMGEDGHFASLFPGNPALAEGIDPNTDKIVLAAPAGSPAPPQPRLTLTVPALRDARVCLLLITGAAKRAVVEAPAERPISAALAHLKPRVLWAP